MKLDAGKIQANSITTRVSPHLILLTDLPSSQDIDQFNEVFEKAIPQWCDYFGIEPATTKDWQLRAMIMGDKLKFERAGLLQGIPQFPAGFQTGHDMWVYLQPGNYYTRHLLLHEGTHSFMQWFLGGTGAPWYTEGMAELLGLHQWRDRNLTINFQLTDRSQAEYWGRIKIIKEDLQNENGMKLDDVLNIPNRAFREVRYYAWSWAACQFLSQHELSKEQFNELKHKVTLSRGEFNREFEQSIQSVRQDLDRDWELFIHEIDFGFDINRGRLKSVQSNSELSFEIEVDTSWQQTNIDINVGDVIKVAASGRFIVRQPNGEKPWPCEANGITIDYYRGRPLGQLLLAIYDSRNTKSLLEPITLDRYKNFTSNRSGKLCLRINESPAHLKDNQGKLKIEIKKIKKKS